MIVKETGSGDFQSVEPGTYAAVCYRVIDLGTQTNTYEGKQTSRHQVLLSFELDELMEDGRPFSVSMFLTASLHEKATMRKVLESWRGRAFTADELAGFDLRAVLGKPCMVSVVVNDKGKTKVASVSKLPKGMHAPKAVNPQLHFDLAEFDAKAFEQIPDGLKKIITQSPEYHAAIATGNGWSEDSPSEPPPDLDDDSRVPF